jgi:hypothetical protein
VFKEVRGCAARTLSRRVDGIGIEGTLSAHEGQASSSGFDQQQAYTSGSRVMDLRRRRTEMSW